jgi:hypothetical protein
MTLPDPNFPAVGPVYDEGVKFLPGVGGESRSGDANGKWFRVLLVAPRFATPTVNGNFLLSANQILGENPPKPGPVAGEPNGERPVLRPDVPCETQKPPNLSTAIGAPPAGQHAIAQPSTPAALGIVAAAQNRGDALVRQQIKDAHLQNQQRVSDTPITAKQIPRPRTAGGGGK